MFKNFNKKSTVQPAGAKGFLYIFALLFVVKFLLLFWSSHPFDFWAFVNTIQRTTLYGWNVFEYWNKGNLLLIIWGVSYSAYLTVSDVFHLSLDNLLLLHFFFKVPFLFLDLFCSYYIFKIVSDIKDIYSGRIAALVWYINPVVFYVYGIHGHYELLTSFAILISIYGLFTKRGLILALGLAISFSTKYFILILFPFYLLYILKNDFKSKILPWVYSVIIVLVFYSHFLFQPILISQNLQSVLALSKANAPLFLSEIKLSPLNVLSATNEILGRPPISNTNNPEIFSLANKGIVFVIVILLIHYACRYYFVYVRKQIYSKVNFLLDITISLSYFVVFLTNFQIHYSVWILPSVVLLLFLVPAIDFILSFLTIAVFIYEIKGEYGVRTFFLDVATWTNSSWLNSSVIEKKYFLGTFIILLILALLFVLLGRVAGFYKDNQKNSGNNLKLYFIFAAVVWVMIIASFGQYINYYLTESVENNTTLAFSRGKIHRGLVFSNYQIDEIKDNQVIFSNRSRNGSLASYFVQLLSKKEKLNFSTSIILTDISATAVDFKNIRFNDCIPLMEGNLVPAINYFDQKTYQSVKYDTECLKATNNMLVFPDNKYVSKNSFELYVNNENVGYPYLERLRTLIYLGAFVFFILVSFVIMLSIRLAKKMSLYA